MTKLLRRSMLVFCMLFGGANAAILQISGGELTGATGVNVGGTLYNVQFVDGGCNLFANCTVFPFASGAIAQQASQALLDQVFLDGALGLFDTNPQLTVGCESTTICNVWTFLGAGIAGGIFIQGFDVAPNSSSVLDSPPTGTARPGFNTTGDPEVTLALWTVQPQAVPEPDSIAILGLGLLGLILTRRRRSLKREW